MLEIFIVLYVSSPIHIIIQFEKKTGPEFAMRIVFKNQRVFFTVIDLYL